jgi:UDP-N-acetylglucosamine 2-epimerase (non-hydrolysing)
MKKVLVAFGTRPEAIKMAPLIKTLSTSFKVSVCVTGQHRKMLDQVLDLFQITPDIDLDIMRDSQDLFDITSSILTSFKQVLDSVDPHIVLVHGDTSTSFACALSSFYKKIPVAHVEAGLRTNDIYSPFPEELNRQLTSSIATLHFAPTQNSKKNLLKEGVKPKNIFITGNTIVDSLKDIEAKARKENFPKNIIDDLPFLLEDKEIVLITGHRRENFGKGFEEICYGIRDLASEFLDRKFVYPVHLNPQVLKPVKDILGDVPNVFLTDPVQYITFIKLMLISSLIITDSGGIQEEAPSFSVPVLVMRDSTERPEAIESGHAKLVGACRESILEEGRNLLKKGRQSSNTLSSANPFGDGNASERIKEILLDFFDE